MYVYSESEELNDLKVSTNDTSTIYISYLQIHIDIDREESCHYYLDREESCHYNLDKEESCHYNLDREESRPSVSIPTPGEAPTTQAQSLHTEMSQGNCSPHIEHGNKHIIFH